jgi:hypothetical protein
MAIIRLNNQSISSVTALPSGVGGKVLQVVNSSTDYNQNIATTSNTDLNSASGVVWETSLTPSSTSSKILITGAISLNSYYNGNAEGRSSLFIYYKIGAGSYTQLKDYNELIGVYDYGNSGVWGPQVCPINSLITPSTTDAVTIKFQGKCNNGSAVQVFNTGTSDSQITLKEIAS